ncbi:MAG: DUF167 domain-containing protein [Staphylothermus sp.]|nr:DUF167 domain-containing protein [Staphylothermus sp.]
MSEEIKEKIYKLVTESKDGVIINLYVKPGSNREALVLEGDELVFYTTEIPEKGRANAALIRFLSKSVGLPISKIDIIYGVRDRTKRVLIEDIGVEQLVEKLLSVISK